MAPCDLFVGNHVVKHKKLWFDPKEQEFWSETLTSLMKRRDSWSEAGEIVNFLVSDFKYIACFECPQNRKIHDILDEIAVCFNVAPESIMLTYRNYPVAYLDTPTKIELKDGEMIECSYKFPKETTEHSYKFPKETIEYSYPKKFTRKETCSNFESADDCYIEIRLQSNDLQSKTFLVVKQTDCMQVIMEDYANLRNIPVHKINFEFDGEKLTGTETPLELEMESGSIIDVIVPANIGSYFAEGACGYDSEEKDELLAAELFSKAMENRVSKSDNSDHTILPD